MANRPFPVGILRKFALFTAALVVLAGCNASNFPKAQKPVPGALVAKMSQLGMKATSQIFIRIFKEELQMEIWKEQGDGRFALLKTYDICKWSGELGPKKKEGDRQAPEGFYTVTPAQMNPNSSYYLSFNIGYPNAYDRSLGRTGSNLMVHGACSSAGCYSMTDADAGEIFALARDSFRGGQTSFQIQAFPFRMTPENLARHRDNSNMEFWRMLKVGYDTFELTHKPPKVDVCDQHYVFDADANGATFSAAQSCPAYTTPAALTAALDRKQAEDDAKFSKAVAMLEDKSRQDSEARQAAADRAAEAERRAAARAANPSIIDRLLGNAQPQPATEPAVPITPAKVPSKAAAAKIDVPPAPKPAPDLAKATPAPKKAAIPTMAAAAPPPARRPIPARSRRP